MEGTPKIEKRRSLSLSRRIKSKRQSSSPQNLLRAAQSAASSGGIDSTTATAPRSPSVMSISSDGGVECTPPHKKLNFDDSLDYSPNTLDCSFSPTGMLSQTLAIESPDVGWKWNRTERGTVEDAAATTPDSAYAADSSCTSAGSSSTEALRTGVRLRSDAQRQRAALNMRRQDQRRTAEEQLRRAEKLKMDEMLKRRCAKLKEQLEEAKANALKGRVSEETLALPRRVQTRASMALSKQQTPSALEAPIAAVDTADDICDFFNDTESDDLLLEATQKLESQIIELTQTASTDVGYGSRKLVAPIGLCETQSRATPSRSSCGSNKSKLTPQSLIVTTPKSSNKHSSSLYSKFLEDDSADDWFISLDESVFQAAHNSSRTLLQRYKSMPIGAIAKKGAGKSENSMVTTSQKDALDTAAGAATSKGLKRHASSHTMSPASTSCKLQP